MRTGETLLQRVLKEDVSAQVVRLDLLLLLLNEIFEQSSQFASSAPLMLLMASILKVCQSGRAVSMLAEEGMVEEILTIGRTLVELTVNATYLQCVDDKELGKYLSFHPELSFRQAGLMQQGRRTSPTGVVVEKVRDLMESLGFPGRRGGGDASWTKRSLVTRAQISDETTNIPLMSLLLSRCYSRGEAAVHGNVGALDSFIAAVQTNEMPTREDRFRELSEALFGVNLTIMTFGMFLNEFFHLGMDEALSQISTADSSSRPSLAGE